MRKCIEFRRWERYKLWTNVQTNAVRSDDSVNGRLPFDGDLFPDVDGDHTVPGIHFCIGVKSRYQKKRNRVECYRYHLLHPTLVVSSATQGSTVYSPLSVRNLSRWVSDSQKTNLIKNQTPTGRIYDSSSFANVAKFFFNQVEGNLNGFICSYSCC